ncbi:hypothetical protein BR93DRAFT_946878 [Coniochaeta sp. PMI_546]|nr:hypothetical protein BR93DRAFT_946878 [Coniochaeta sp. PMI_546]
MRPLLRMPLPSLSADNFVARRAAGHVFRISSSIVFKCPTQFDNPFPQRVEEMKDSIRKIEAEKAVYRVLMKQRHPNIVQCILCVPEGTFLRRMETAIQERLSQSGTATVSPRIQERWIGQLTSAVAWLERLGFVHGDLPPANILFDANENIHLGDFDATVKPGQELIVASEPFCKMNEDFEPPLAGPVSEQFSLASCICTIRFGHWPWHDLDPSVRVRKLLRNEFPAVSAESPLRRDIKQDILVRLEGTVVSQDLRQEALSEEDAVEYLKLRAECEEFVANQAPGMIS